MGGEQGVGPGPAGGVLQGRCVEPAPCGAAQPNTTVPAPTGMLLTQMMAPGGPSMGLCCHPAQGLPKKSQAPLARTGSSLTLRTRRAGLCCPGMGRGQQPRPGGRWQGYTMTGLSVPSARSNPPGAGGWTGPCSSWGAKPLRDGLLSAQVVWEELMWVWGRVGWTGLLRGPLWTKPDTGLLLMSHGSRRTAGMLRLGCPAGQRVLGASWGEGCLILLLMALLQ